MRIGRSLLRRARDGALEWSGANARARARLDGSCAAVLMYHRVLPRAEARARAVEPGMFVTPETFARHVDWLADGFRVLPLGEIATRLAEDRPLPPGACAISFDDGWRDNLEHASPELSRRGLPATVFLVVDRVGTRGAFWPDEVCRRLAPLPPRERRRVARELGAASSSDPISSLLAHLKATPEAERGAALERLRVRCPDPGADDRELLDWDEIDAMATRGIEFESHGLSHAILTGVSPEIATRELADARSRLRERGHGREDLLAYPSGAADPSVMRLARQAGYRCAFTTARGLASAADDPMALPRLGLHDDVSATRSGFHARVPGAAPVAVR